MADLVGFQLQIEWKRFPALVKFIWTILICVAMLMKSAHSVELFATVLASYWIVIFVIVSIQIM